MRGGRKWQDPGVAVGKDSVLVHLGLLSHQCHPRGSVGPAVVSKGPACPALCLLLSFPIGEGPFPTQPLVCPPGSRHPSCGPFTPSTAGTRSVDRPGGHQAHAFTANTEWEHLFHGRVKLG